NEDFLYNAQAGHDREYYKEKDASKSKAIINIENTGSGDIYGLKSSSYVYNAYSYYDSDAEGKIRISNDGTGNAYGMFGEYINNAYAISENDNYHATANGYVNILNKSSGNAYGMFGKYISNNSSTGSETQNSVIEMANVSSGLAVGMYAKDGHAENTGNIKIHNLGNGTAVGIYADGYSGVTNTGSITIDRTAYTDDMATDDTSDDVTHKAQTSKGGLAIGIYGGFNSNITNEGTITINDADEAYGIYAEKGATVTNNGQIIIDGNTSHANAIKLNGGKLFQDGILIAGSETTAQCMLMSIPTLLSTDIEPIQNTEQTPIKQEASLNLNDFDGTVIASATSQFIVEGSISGDLLINNNVVSKGFETEYRVSDMIQASDTSNLNLISQSAMFDAKLENGKDTVMTMKSFDEVFKNKSFANFLENNYALQNNEALFGDLKSKETLKSLNNFANELFGKDMFSRFAFEDLMIMRELNFDINNKLFNNTEDYISIGSTTSSFAFSGDSRYSLTSSNFGNYSVGISVAFSDINSEDDNDDNQRNDTMYNIAAPIGYQINNLKLITTPRIGYSYGTYDRNGFNDEIYEGTVEKQMFALMNEARYPLQVKGWNISPSVELNFINYHLSGHENNKAYSLKIKSQNTYSIEAGLGIYANKETELTKNSSLNFNGGLSVYHEFADPHKMELGMRGMSGTFTLRDENRSDNRAVVQSEIEFKHNNISLTGNVISYIDRKSETEASIDFRFDF
ncbi:MAG: autotransporter outer membrane beta-barrel domain-containing protein, partial [Alphaproteobacteria bacterium]|nr:autotransporter outer membrane beta-barrel domain-containing protein [Alphaproteobacteria bacterium]